MHKIGWHLDNTKPVDNGGWAVISAVPPTAVLNIPGGGTVQDIERILGANPSCHIFIRPYYVPTDDEWSKGDYIDKVESMIREGHWQNVIPEGQRHLQLFNEQNMPLWSQYEGFGDNLEGMQKFDKWFREGYNRIKAIDPTWKIGWTPLTPGNRDVFFPNSPDPQNVPYYMHGSQAAKPEPTQEEIYQAVTNGPCYNSLRLADEYYAHIYCMSPENEIDKLWAGLRFVQYAKFFPKAYESVWILECGIGGDPSWAPKWYQILQSYPAVKGTAYWRLGVEIRNVDERVNALRDYINNLPSTPVQPILWPEPVTNGEPAPPPPPPSPDPIPDPPPECEEALNTTDDELSCIIEADFQAVLDFYEAHGNPIDTDNQKRCIICRWLGSEGFIDEYGTWQKYLEKFGCREPEVKPPSIDFHGAPTSGVAPLSVQFFNTSVGDYQALEWDFGDGTFRQNDDEPIKVYTELGAYDITLALFQGDKMYTFTQPDYITVIESEPSPIQQYKIAISGTLVVTIESGD